ncbi:E3 SUMO-protein ligase pli1 [Linderina macrospora]|uniref:E3 SUMO-protein ligase pli1 n=1 Tax=Linderina macrospora TaxID=4868 RepID=A0ACC1JB14_9FUNG|nr:E3 SUMO-protein ligase pli1 [Linderina macrospora]
MQQATTNRRTSSGANQGLAKIEFKDLSFLSPQRKISSVVMCRETRGRQVSMSFKFKLSADLVETLTKNVGRPEKVQYGVYLYMCSHTTAADFANNPSQNALAVQYPSMFSAVVNGRSIQPPTQRTNQEPLPWNMTELVNMHMGVENSVCIIYTSHTSWVAVVMLVQQNTAESVVRQIQETSHVDAQAVRRQFFRGAGNDDDDDDDVVADGALISLKCPLGLVRITTPMRSKYCNHSQCFDGEVFLKMNEQSPTWKCPICLIAIKSWHELVVDGYFEEILHGTLDSDDQVHVDPDGAWRRKDAAETPSAAATATERSSRAPAAEAIDLSDMEMADAGALSSRRSKTEVVDLTLDSDSESDAELNGMLADLENDDLWIEEAVSQAELGTPSGTQGDRRPDHPDKPFASDDSSPVLASQTQRAQTSGGSSAVAATTATTANGSTAQARPHQANGGGSRTSLNGSRSAIPPRPPTSTTAGPPSPTSQSNIVGHQSPAFGPFAQWSARDPWATAVQQAQQQQVERLAVGSDIETAIEPAWGNTWSMPHQSQAPGALAPIPSSVPAQTSPQVNGSVGATTVARQPAPEQEQERHQQSATPEQRTATPPASSGVTIATASIQQRRDPFKFKPSTKAASKRGRVRVVDASGTSPSANGTTSDYGSEHQRTWRVSSGPPPASFMRPPMDSMVVTPTYGDRTLPPILAAPVNASVVLNRSSVLDFIPSSPSMNTAPYLGSSPPPLPPPPVGTMMGMSPTYMALFTSTSAASNQAPPRPEASNDDSAGF